MNFPSIENNIFKQATLQGPYLWVKVLRSRFKISSENFKQERNFTAATEKCKRSSDNGFALRSNDLGPTVAPYILSEGATEPLSTWVTHISQPHSPQPKFDPILTGIRPNFWHLKSPQGPFWGKTGRLLSGERTGQDRVIDQVGWIGLWGRGLSGVKMEKNASSFGNFQARSWTYHCAPL